MKTKNRKKQKIPWPEFPSELDPQVLQLHYVDAGELLVEQHRGVLDFSGTEVSFRTEQGTVTFCGDALQIETLTEHRAKIIGKLRSIVLGDKS